MIPATIHIKKKASIEAFFFAIMITIVHTLNIQMITDCACIELPIDNIGGVAKCLD